MFCAHGWHSQQSQHSAANQRPPLQRKSKVTAVMDRSGRLILSNAAFCCCFPRRPSGILRLLCSLAVGLLIGTAVIKLAVRIRNGLLVGTDANLTGHEYQQILASLPKQSQESSRCQSPQLPLYNEFISRNRPKSISPNLCKSLPTNWLWISNSKVYLKPEFAEASCSAEPIVRIDDQTSVFGKPQPIINGSDLPSFGFRATCKLNRSRNAHRSVYYGVRSLPVIQQQQRVHRGDQDNIIILGIDSISRLESLRSLPKVNELVTSRLGGITLEHYNILGDGTPAALLPILTGVKEEDMPEGRKGFQGARHLDETMRWIFQDLREQGYRTLHGEEGNGYGTFQLRFLGFRNEPVDFYMRPVLQQQEYLHQKGICIGDEISSGRMLQAVKDMFVLYPDQPKFAFLFFASLSHDNYDLSPMDSELSSFLEWFESENLAQNTTLIFMSDHGQRLGPLRNSMQGKLEESLPRMTFALSHQLMKRSAGALDTLKRNAKQLTTPLDIHETLLRIAGVKRLLPEVNGNVKSYSLIDQSVPDNRSCSTAGIPTHWCSCLSSVKQDNPSSSHLSIRSAHYAVSQINEATRALRNICEELKLSSVEEAEISLASGDLAKRVRYIKNHYAVNEENKELKSSGYVTVRFVTAPSNGLYEATVQFSLLETSWKYVLKFSLVGETSRINRYGSQADCVTNKFPHLRKFCFCRATRAK